MELDPKVLTAEMMELDPKVLRAEMIVLFLSGGCPKGGGCPAEKCWKLILSGGLSLIRGDPDPKSLIRGCPSGVCPECWGYYATSITLGTVIFVFGFCFRGKSQVFHWQSSGRPAPGDFQNHIFEISPGLKVSPRQCYWRWKQRLWCRHDSGNCNFRICVPSQRKIRSLPWTSLWQTSQWGVRRLVYL